MVRILADQREAVPCCQYRPLRVPPEEPESTTTALVARRIGRGACSGRGLPKHDRSDERKAQSAHCTQRFKPSQTVLSVPGVISQWQWSQHIFKEDSFFKVMLAAGSWMGKNLAGGLCALC
jgi:hypothetical protein